MASPPPDQPRPSSSPAPPTELGTQDHAASGPAESADPTGRETWDAEAATDVRADARAHPGDARASTPRGTPATAMEDEEAPPARPSSGAPPLVEPPVPELPERYADRGLLGMGGMGEVRRVYDRVLDRMVAMKLVRAERAGAPDARPRITAEARATARLAHPGIVPVYDQGVTPDGRAWFTMQEIRGQDLAGAIERLHRESPPGPLPFGFRRLVDLLERAARAVAHAHDLGVVHRDLKPSNVVIGDHGEVTVVDWGLVRPVGVSRGRIQGTPAYMAPEQARGAADTRSDVWGLGMILWEICAGIHPFAGRDTREILAVLERGESPGQPVSPWPVPEELRGLLADASNPAPERRPANGGVFADRLRAWLDGEGRREMARACIRSASEKEASIAGLRAAEREAREEARSRLESSQPWEPDTTREAAWEAEDRADALARAVAAAAREVEGELEAALIHDPDSFEAHSLLAHRARVAMDDAERAGDGVRAAQLELRLQRHLGALPVTHPERVRATTWLRGDGAVTLHTDPPGARVELYRYTTARRRRVPEHVGTLGTTPLISVPLARGSWLLEIHHPDRLPVRYPVAIDRETHWDGIAPGETAPTPVRLPRPDELGPDDCYVPAGWTTLGGDPLAPAGLPSLRVWVDGFVLRRFPVTQGEYVRFLDDLVARGEGDRAERLQPRDRGATPGTWGVPFYGRTPDGRFELVTDADGDTWLPEWPVFYVDHAAAWEYARWLRDRSGQPWRLPMELEWEKAARGVDRRIWPWGDHVDPTWCTNRLAFPGGTLHHEGVGSRPTDESPYGVRDLSGGVVDLTASRMTVGGDTPDGGRVIPVDGSEETEAAWAGRTATWRVAGRGGSLLHDLNASRAAFRVSVDPWIHSSNLGFRLARSLG